MHGRIPASGGSHRMRFTVASMHFVPSMLFPALLMRSFFVISYLVRQRSAFLEGIKPPDFCEGAVEKTCDEESRLHC